MKNNTVVIRIAWLLYTASWFIQAVEIDLGKWGDIHMAGWQAFVAALSPEQGEQELIHRFLSASSALTNLLMIVAPAILWSRFENVKSTLPWLFLLATVLDAHWFILCDRTELRAGYYLWCTSFFMIAVACSLSQRADRAARTAARTQATQCSHAAIQVNACRRDV